MPDDAAVEFDCVECGRHIVRMVGPRPDPLICAHCLLIPGWHEDPVLARLIDPE